MITHYDMATGEMLTTEGRDDDTVPEGNNDTSVALRLLTVAEATAIEQTGSALPADVAVLPVDQLLARWR